jgi:hypothetical protein
MDTGTNENSNLEVQNFASNEELYASITKEGSLGLLALGASGLLLWRKKRAELEAAEEKEKQNEQK